MTDSDEGGRNVESQACDLQLGADPAVARIRENVGYSFRRHHRRHSATMLWSRQSTGHVSSTACWGARCRRSTTHNWRGVGALANAALVDLAAPGSGEARRQV